MILTQESSEPFIHLSHHSRPESFHGYSTVSLGVRVSVNGLFISDSLPRDLYLIYSFSDSILISHVVLVCFPHTLKLIVCPVCRKLSV